jgi:hypothetical protein
VQRRPRAAAMFCKLWVQGDSEFSFLADAIIMSLVPLSFVCVCVCLLDLEEDGACEHAQHQASSPVCLCVVFRGVLGVASLTGQRSVRGAWKVRFTDSQALLSSSSWTRAGTRPRVSRTAGRPNKRGRLRCQPSRHGSSTSSAHPAQTDPARLAISARRARYAQHGPAQSGAVPRDREHSTRHGTPDKRHPILPWQIRSTPPPPPLR